MFNKVDTGQSKIQLSAITICLIQNGVNNHGGVFSWRTLKILPCATTLTPPHESFLSLTKFEKDLLLPI